MSASNPKSATPHVEHAAIAPVRVAHTICGAPSIQRSHWKLAPMHHDDCAAMSFQLRPPPLRRQKSTTAAPISSPPSEPACRATSRTLPSRARAQIQDLQCRTLPREYRWRPCANIGPFPGDAGYSSWPQKLITTDFSRLELGQTVPNVLKILSPTLRTLVNTHIASYLPEPLTGLSGAVGRGSFAL